MLSLSLSSLYLPLSFILPLLFSLYVSAVVWADVIKVIFTLRYAPIVGMFGEV